jgi:DNA-binding NarL/FixJ family response regulator
MYSYDLAAMTRIRVVLAEDHVLLREGISRLVEATADMELAGSAGDLPGLLALAEREQPDVVVTDIRMPPTGTDEGIQAAAWIRAHLPGAGVVVLIRAVAAGGSVIDPAVVDQLVRARRFDGESGLASLTPRELEILAEMAQGKSNSAIAAALFVTERAVEKHTNSIFAKLNLTEEPDVNRRVKAVLVFLDQGRQAS